MRSVLLRTRAQGRSRSRAHRSRRSNHSVPHRARGAERSSEINWRRRVGIEPDRPKLSPRPNGFEVRASHQTRFASAMKITQLRQWFTGFAVVGIAGHPTSQRHAQQHAQLFFSVWSSAFRRAVRRVTIQSGETTRVNAELQTNQTRSEKFGVPPSGGSSGELYSQRQTARVNAELQTKRPA